MDPSAHRPCAGRCFLCPVPNESGLLPQVESRINVEERIGKVVGNRRAPRGLPGADRYTPADARAWQQAFSVPSVPRGVYRFTSHQEADAWLMKMITRTRPSPANPPSPISGISVGS